MHRCVLVCLAVSIALTPCMAGRNAQPKPGCVCTAIYDPVCGSDGVDYSSACQADCAGVTVASHGICRAAGAGSTAAPISSSSSSTPAIQLPGGVSITLPSIDGRNSDCECSSVANPVCGEDGQTYTNECQASCAGVLIASVGACKPQTPSPTPMPAATPKPPSEVTQEDGPAAAGAAPGGCVCAAVYTPVCGANGKTYGNQCEADCAGVAVTADRECKDTQSPPPPAAAAAAPKAAVAPAPPAKPEGCVCAALYDPVCGANGKDYPSACDADCAGVSVASKGVCQKQSPVAAPVATPAAAAAAAPAESTPAPCVCAKHYAPVCTDTGVTRSNECAARCQGEKVVTEGSCNKPITDEKSTASAPAAAAGLAAAAQDTAADASNNAADTPAIATKAAAAGVDKATAAAGDKATANVTTKAAAAPSEATCGDCGDSYAPVCGTDGVTYSNKCEAECLNGIKVAFDGVCASRGITAAAAAAANGTANATRSSALGLRGSVGVFGGCAAAAATLLAMLWL